MKSILLRITSKCPSTTQIRQNWVAESFSFPSFWIIQQSISKYAKINSTSDFRVVQNTVASQRDEVNALHEYPRATRVNKKIQYALFLFWMISFSTKKHTIAAFVSILNQLFVSFHPCCLPRRVGSELIIRSSTLCVGDN